MRPGTVSRARHLAGSLIALVAATLGASAAGASSPGAIATSDPASVPQRWVSPTGSDTAPGTLTAPWRTLQHAADTAPAGAVVTIRSGRYPGFTVQRAGLTFSGESRTGTVIEDAVRRNVVDIRAPRTVLQRVTVRGGTVEHGAGVRVAAGSGPVRVADNDLLDNSSFGVRVRDTTGVTITGNRIARNDTGIEIAGASRGTVISANAISGSAGMIGCDRGGNAIVFYRTAGVVARDNRVWGNRARHCDDEGYDGGAFEVYGSSDLLIERNRLWDNNNVMETGTDGTLPCSRIRFLRNVAWSASTVPGGAHGMILRCASESTVAHNVFHELDLFAFSVDADDADHGGSIEGLRIQNNIVLAGRAYSIESALPTSVVIDHDLVWPAPSGTALYADRVAYVSGRGNTSSIAEFRLWTGRGARSVQARPALRDPLRRDYRPSTMSPAIDRGAPLGLTYAGRGPDIGAHEAAP